MNLFFAPLQLALTGSDSFLIKEKRHALVMKPLSKMAADLSKQRKYEGKPNQYCILTK